MKKVLLVFALLLATTMAMGQIKVLSNGKVGIGTNSVNWETKLQIADGGNNIAIAPNAGGTNVGAYKAGGGTARLDFWHSVSKWNNIRMRAYSLSSDTALKRDIYPIENATTILKQIKAYSYYFKSDSVEDSTKDYGVLAQEIEEILPELVDTAKGDMFVNYNAFIGILIAGFNEQQTLLEQQQNKIEILQKIITTQETDLIELKTLLKDFYQLQEHVYKCCGTPKGGLHIPEQLEGLQFSQEKAILYQNTPNPFSSNTEIAYNLPVTAQQAMIYIYNLQGAELKSYSLTQTGLNTITVYGSELPAGMYLYTLVVNNEIIDTKRMILTK